MVFNHLMSNTNTANTAADIKCRINDIKCRINDIKACAFGMGVKLNAGQLARIASLETELAELAA